ncbi:PspA/IM30 family protein [Sphingomonas sp. Leaf357]|uniref:PspA/IM30 family protein n=1 Tax=Sphingomonas sp. Leaf357 TaxID=1736350 RepID=UPI000A7021C3|nr:PspA/IM30 family protein [Sphingomonas sp. Leaf357]
MLIATVMEVRVAESILVRVRRLLSARIEDSVDAMERANNDGVMREAIREVDRTIDAVRGDQERAMTRRLQAARQTEMIARKVEELTAKARFAVDGGRDDLAEGALKRQIDLEQQTGNLGQVQDLAREEEAKLDESLAALRGRKAQMQEALAAFEIARADASMGGDGGFSQARHVEHKVEQAEAAFDRAMTGAGGVGFARGDVGALNSVAEIDAMQKSATVAQRLAALKQAPKAA